MSRAQIRIRHYVRHAPIPLSHMSTAGSASATANPRGQQRGRFGFRRFESDRDDPGPHSGTFGAWFEDNVETLLARMPGRSRRARSIDNRCAPLPIGSCRFLHAVTSPKLPPGSTSRSLAAAVIVDGNRAQATFLPPAYLPSTRECAEANAASASWKGRALGGCGPQC